MARTMAIRPTTGLDMRTTAMRLDISTKDNRVMAMESPYAPGDMVRRHRLTTRLWHWLNALLLYILFTSGLGIFNAHPRLYWGHYGANFDHAWLELDRFPGWITLPALYNLALSRHWHLTAAPIFAFALLFYMLWGLAGGHIARDLAFRRGELAPRHVWQDIRDHARLRFPTGAAALRYNVLQKASYIAVIFIALPLLILTGLTMSPGMNAAWPWLVDLFGGRQSARSIHFLAAFALVAFFLVHMLMVLLAGPVNEIGSMITGRYRLPKDRP
jgi:thiosulfate reductase cytochrome b subunit